MKPDYAGAHNNLGIAYYERGSLNEAIHEYEECLRLEPANAEALYNLGLAFYDKGATDKALVALNRFINIAPADYWQNTQSAQKLISAMSGEKPSENI